MKRELKPNTIGPYYVVLHNRGTEKTPAWDCCDYIGAHYNENDFGETMAFYSAIEDARQAMKVWISRCLPKKESKKFKIVPIFVDFIR